MNATATFQHIMEATSNGLIKQGVVFFQAEKNMTLVIHWNKKIHMYPLKFDIII